MPKGNGDVWTPTHQTSRLLVRNTVNAERQWRLAPAINSASSGSNGQEHGECRKAMETPRRPSRCFHTRSCQEHGECRKAMETGLSACVIASSS